MIDSQPPPRVPANAIAVTGLAGRWPGAATPEALWDVLVSGWETVSHFSEEELEWTSSSEEARRKGLANDLLPRCRELWNMYGPTETTIWSTCGRVTGQEGPIDTGRPIANTQIYILDASGAPLPPGQAGLLHIAGDGLATGYLGCPDLTAKKFLPCPFGNPERKRRMYVTGDLARWLPDGRIECLGRIDHQIKLRGFRIELGEIESALMEHTDVALAAAILREDDPGRPRLVAYVQPAETSGREKAQSVGWQAQWEVLFGEAIRQAASDGRDIGSIDSIITGWTGETSLENEVEEWITSTVARLASLHPCRVLEIGCGTGQILLRLAPNTAEYTGTDFIQSAVDSLTARTCNLPHVTLRCQPADDFTGIAENHYDTVIINSVIQYFPGDDYLRDVIEGARRALCDEGRIFLGDLQSASLLACHHTARQLAQNERVIHGRRAARSRGQAS